MKYTVLRKYRRMSGLPTLILMAAAVLAVILTSRIQAEDNKVRIGYYENEVFEEGAREGAVRTGYAYEYYRKISEYTGWEYEYVFGSFGDLYQALLDHEVDLLAGLAYREDREAILSYPEAAMGHESYNLLKHAENEEITSNPETMNGRTIVILDSAMVDVLQNYLDEQKIDAQIAALPDYEQVFEAFDNREADLIAVEGNGTYGRSDVEILCSFGYSDYYLCVNKERPDLLKELNDAQTLLRIDEPNYLNSLNEKYYPFTLFSRAFSEDEKEWIHTHDEIRVGYLEDYLPYTGTNETGEVTGLIKDVVPHLFETLGITDLQIRYQGYASYDAMLRDVDNGTVDVVFPVGGGLYFSEENGIYQTNPVTQTTNELIFSGKYTDDTVSHFAVNENNKIHEYYVRTYFPDAEITNYASAERCLDAVLNGEVKSTFLNGLRATDILKNRKYRDLSLMHLNWNDDRCFGVRIGNDGLLKLLNRGLNVIGTDYAQNRVYLYTDQLHRESLLDYILDHIAAFAALVLFTALLIILLLIRDSRKKRAMIHEKETAQQILEEKNQELEENRKALSEALDTAETANRAKTAFLNNMSHDMRTPMNAIVGFTALAEANAGNEQQVKDYLGKISVSSEQLLSLINDVLDMSRIESGTVKIEETEVYLPDVIRDVQTIIRVNSEAKRQELSVKIGTVEHENIFADKLRLKQILLNILSNAVKFTPEGGSIHFDVTEKPSEEEGTAAFEFRIRDNGIGMSPEFQKTIFDAFTRERTTTISGIQGTGLGMAITKSLVEKMGGTIAVTSEEGKGSEFVVCLPCRINENATKKEDAAASSDMRTHLPDFHGKRVLLAEDNEMNQMIATAILEETGLAVDIAVDGRKAVEKIKESEAGYYDLILMDIQMPEMNGYEAAICIRNLEEPQKARIPIVAVTANAFEEDRKTAMKAGMNAHLAKPYDIPKMMETLSGLL